MTYRLCGWDHERQRWDTMQMAGSVFALRAEIRRLRRFCDDCGLLLRRGRDKIGTRRRTIATEELR